MFMATKVKRITSMITASCLIGCSSVATKPVSPVKVQITCSKTELFPISEEQLKPIPVTSPIDNPILFYIRCLFDLQLKTITDFLRPKLGNICNSVLDIGAGNSPWKSFLGKDVNYIGLDTHASKDFNMKKNDEIIYYSGGIFPFSFNYSEK